jgi:hypothetical protein
MQSTEQSTESGEAITLVTSATQPEAMPAEFDPWGATL